MELREVTAADGESTSLDDLCPGSGEQLRRCINWIGDVWHMVGDLVDRLANEHAAVNLSDHAYSSAIARSRYQAHFLIQQRQGAEDRLACLALQVSEHLLVPLIEIAVACTLINSSDQNVREEGMDRFCAAADWWGREAKSAVELILTAIEDRRRRCLDGLADQSDSERTPRTVPQADDEEWSVYRAPADWQKLMGNSGIGNSSSSWKTFKRKHKGQNHEDSGDRSVRFPLAELRRVGLPEQ